MTMSLFFSGVGMFGFAGMNFLMATAPVSETINWFAGLVSIVAGFVCLGMVVHMRNSKIHVPDAIDFSKLVDHQTCNERVATIEKLQKMSNKMLKLMIANAGLRIPKYILEDDD